MLENMSIIEIKYRESLRKMSGIEKVERTLTLFNSIKEMIQLKIINESGNLNSRQLQKKVAKKLYVSDEEIQKLINKASEE